MRPFRYVETFSLKMGWDIHSPQNRKSSRPTSSVRVPRKLLSPTSPNVRTLETTTGDVPTLVLSFSATKDLLSATDDSVYQGTTLRDYITQGTTRGTDTDVGEIYRITLKSSVFLLPLSELMG